MPQRRYAGAQYCRPLASGAPRSSGKAPRVRRCVPLGFLCLVGSRGKRRDRPHPGRQWTPVLAPGRWGSKSNTACPHSTQRECRAAPLRSHTGTRTPPGSAKDLTKMNFGGYEDHSRYTSRLVSDFKIYSSAFLRRSSLSFPRAWITHCLSALPPSASAALALFTLLHFRYSRRKRTRSLRLF